MNHAMWILAVIFTGWGAWLDWRSRRIPNWLTVPVFLIGVAAHTIAFGWPGARTALEGALIPLVILLPVVLLRGLGAGDWKLMGALGSILGWKQILLVFLASIAAAGVMGVVQMIREKRMWRTLVNLGELVRGFIIFGIRPHPEISLDNPQAVALPFGVAAAAATALCYWANAAGLVR